MLAVFRGLIAAMLMGVSLTIGLIVSSEFTSLNVETFIFNKFDLTSLKVFTGQSRDLVAKALYGNVARWFIILFLVAVAVELIVLIYIAISTVLRTLKQNPEKQAETTKMIKDFVLGLVVLFGMSIFIITIISINNFIVSVLSKDVGGDNVFNTLTLQLFLDIFSLDIMVGTQSLILYIIISTMGLIFFVYYMKRLLKVSFLIIIAPLVAVTFAIDRRKGGAKRLLEWSKMFIYTVFIQVIHVLTYVSFLTVVLKGTTGSSTRFIPSMILLVAGLKFLWDSETIIGELFGISADKVQGSSAFMMGFLTQASKLNKARKSFAKTAPDIKTPTGKSDQVPTKKKHTVSTRDLTESVSSKGLMDKAKEKLKDEAEEKANAKDVITKRKALSDKDIEKARKRAARREKIVSNIYDKRPLKGLGTATKEYTISKAKRLGQQTYKRTKKSALRLMAQATVGGITAVASHATPQVGMIESGLVGAKTAGWGIDQAQTARNKRKFDGKSKLYYKNLKREAEQLNALNDRRKKLGPEKSDDKTEEIEDKTKKELEEGKEPEDQEEVLPDEEKDKDVSQETRRDETTGDELDAYARSIADTDKKTIDKRFAMAKKASIQAFAAKEGQSEFKAKQHVAKLLKGLLEARDFDYKTLEAVDRQLLHRFVDVITKQRIDDFEHNMEGYNIREHDIKQHPGTERITYKDVRDLAKELNNKE